MSTTAAPRHRTFSAVWIRTLAALAVAMTTGHAMRAAADPPDRVTSAEPAGRPDRHPELTRLSPTEEVWVDPTRKQVVVGGRIALDKGGVEVFACPEHSKEHEAVVATLSTARLVHAGLLAIGLEPGHPVSFDPEYTAARGPVVEVRMRWRDSSGAVRERAARELIRNRRTQAALDTDWVFAGSVVWKDPADGTEYYQADGGDLICVSNFPTATLDLPLESSQSNEALLFEVFPGRVPPRDTEVDLILSAGR
jgi:hypothetical protein